MDNSNQPAVEPANTNAAPAAAAAPQPVVPKASAPASNGVVPAGKPGSSKGLVIGLIIGGVAIIACVLLGVFLIPKFFGVDWEETKAAAKKLYDVNSAISSDCSSATSYATSTSTSKSDYAKYINKCQNAVDEYAAFAESLANVSGVKHNKEIKAKYEEFQKAWNETGPLLKGIPALLSAEHEVILAFDEAKDSGASDLDDNKIASLVKPLREVEAEGVQDIANEMADKIEAYLKIVAKYQSLHDKWYATSYSDPNYSTIYDQYKEARDAYYDADLDMDLDDITSGAEKLDDAAEALYNEMNSQYYDHQ